MLVVTCLALVAGSLGFICPGTKQHTRKYMANVGSDVSNNRRVSGAVIFRLTKHGFVQVDGSMTQLPLGAHAMHIHEKSVGKTVRGSKLRCADGGPHFNPTQSVHGGPKSLARHVGDLGTILAAKTGQQTTALYSFLDTQIRMHPSQNNADREIICRSVMVHRSKDDEGLGGLDAGGQVINQKRFEESLRTGNAGARLACGTIFPVCGGKPFTEEKFLKALGCF